jgi:predicted permease
VTLAALSGNEYWVISLGLGLVVALVVAFLLAVLVVTVGRIERSVDSLLGIAGGVASNTANIPELQATAPVLEQIVDEAVIQDGYMSALTDGFSTA